MAERLSSTEIRIRQKTAVNAKTPRSKDARGREMGGRGLTGRRGEFSFSALLRVALRLCVKTGLALVASPHLCVFALV